MGPSELGGGRGPEILPGTPEYQWVASIVRAVERRSGARSSWNGKLYEQHTAVLAGAIHFDGSMSMSPRLLAAARLAYTADRPLTDDEKLTAKFAAIMVAHEARHLSSNLGDDTAPDAVKIGSAAEWALEEGLNDTWTHRHAEAVIQDIGMDEVVPGIADVEAPCSYPGFMAATDGVVHGLAETTELAPEKVRDTIHRTPRPQRFNAMADLAIDQRLRGLMPESHRAQLRYRFGGEIKRELGTLSEPEASLRFDADTMSRWGRETGEKAIAGLNKALAQAESHYRTWHEQNPGAEAEPPRMRMSRGELMMLRRVEAQAADPVAAAMTVGQIGRLQQFLGSHTGPATTGSQTGTQADNLRHLGSRRGRGRGVE
jgi:hypothetical protein